MEKQILQALESYRTIRGEEIKKNPELPDKGIRLFINKAIDSGTEVIEEATSIDDYALGITNCIGALLDAAIECGIADRLPELFDAVHIAKMKTIHHPDGETVEPYIKPIMEKDFHEYDEYKDLLLQIQENDNKILEGYVLRNIRARLKKADRDRFNSYLKDEKKLDSIVQVKYQGGGIEDRYATVTVYGVEQEVKVDWAKLVKRQKSKEDE